MENIINKRSKDFSKAADVAQTILIYLVALLTPLFLAQLIKSVFGAGSVVTQNSQLIVGSVVNTALIMAAVNVKGWKNIVALVTVPSISALTSGLVLNISSIFTVYMIPAIWLGNFAIIYAIKYLYIKKNVNYVLSAGAGILAKVALIFGGFNLLTLLVTMPAPVVTALTAAMGINQLITAIIGSALAYGTVKLLYKNNEA